MAATLAAWHITTRLLLHAYSSMNACRWALGHFSPFIQWRKLIRTEEMQHVSHFGVLVDQGIGSMNA